MLKRSKVTVAIGLTCLTGAAVGGGALAHGGGGGGGGGLGSGEGGIRLEVRGLVTALSADSITVAPGGTLAPWTCALPAGADLSDVVVNTTRVRIRCHSRSGVLTASRLRLTEHTRGKVKLKAVGQVTAFTAPGESTPPKTPEDPTTTTTTTTTAPATTAAPTTTTAPTTTAPPSTTTTAPTPPVAPGALGSITLDPGGDLPLVTCAVRARTRVRSVPTVGATAAMKCKSRRDVLVAKRIRVARTTVKPPSGEVPPTTTTTTTTTGDAPKQDGGTNDEGVRGKHRGRG